MIQGQRKVGEKGVCFDDVVMLQHTKVHGHNIIYRILNVPVVPFFHSYDNMCFMYKPYAYTRAYCRSCLMV